MLGPIRKIRARLQNVAKTIRYRLRKTREWFGGDIWQTDTRVRRISSTDFASTPESIGLILLHHTWTVVKTIVWEILLGKGAVAVGFVIGLFKDLWRSDYSYLRYVGSKLVAVLLVFGRVAKWALGKIGGWLFN